MQAGRPGELRLPGRCQEEGLGRGETKAPARHLCIVQGASGLQAWSRGRRPGLEVDVCGAALGEVSTGLSGRGGRAGGPGLLPGCGLQAAGRPQARPQNALWLALSLACCRLLEDRVGVLCFIFGLCLCLTGGW